MEIAAHVLAGRASPMVASKLKESAISATYSAEPKVTSTLARGMARKLSKTRVSAPPDEDEAADAVDRQSGRPPLLPGERISVRIRALSGGRPRLKQSGSNSTMELIGLMPARP